MKFISHRGNINGKNIELENRPEYILRALDLGFEVEIDIWLEGNEWFLGHDNPEYQIDLDWLKISDKLWIHCKNAEAFGKMHILFNDHSKKFNYFWHDIDLFTITSHGYIWGNIGVNLLHNTCKSITVLPENANDIDTSKFSGICSDFIEKYKDEFC